VTEKKQPHQLPEGVNLSWWGKEEDMNYLRLEELLFLFSLESVGKDTTGEIETGQGLVPKAVIEPVAVDLAQQLFMEKRLGDYPDEVYSLYSSVACGDHLLSGREVAEKVKSEQIHISQIFGTRSPLEKITGERLMKSSLYLTNRVALACVLYIELSLLEKQCNNRRLQRRLDEVVEVRNEGRDYGPIPPSLQSRLWFPRRTEISLQHRMGRLRVEFGGVGQYPPPPHRDCRTWCLVDLPPGEENEWGDFDYLMGVSPEDLAFYLMVPREHLQSENEMAGAQASYNKEELGDGWPPLFWGIQIEPETERTLILMLYYGRIPLILKIIASRDKEDNFCQRFAKTHPS